jgi:hypothetical protein
LSTSCVSQDGQRKAPLSREFQADGGTRTLGLFITRERRVRDGRARAGTRGHVLAAIKRFYADLQWTCVPARARPDVPVSYPRHHARAGCSWARRDHVTHQPRSSRSRELMASQERRPSQLGLLPFCGTRSGCSPLPGGRFISGFRAPPRAPRGAPSRGICARGCRRPGRAGSRRPRPVLPRPRRGLRGFRRSGGQSPGVTSDRSPGPNPPDCR